MKMECKGYYGEGLIQSLDWAGRVAGQDSPSRSSGRVNGV